MKRILTDVRKYLPAILLTAAVSFLLQGCSRPVQPLSRTGFYFDTVITLTVYDEKDTAAMENCFSLCEKYENMLSRTVEGSDIYRINHSCGQTVEVSEETAFLLEQALSYAALSGGKTDLTVAPLTVLWNFSGHSGDGANTGSSAGETQSRIPARDDIVQTLAHVGYEKVVLEGNRVTLTDPDTQIDLGFIAKGFIADRLKEYLIGQGVENALINLGGNVAVIGSRPDKTPYKIGIQRPFDTENTAIAVLPVNDSSLVSSGIYERYFEENGKIYHHILDPATGYPTDNGLLSVTILSASSLEADALSTVCFCLGLEEGMQLIESLPDTEAIFITEDYELHPSSGIHPE